MRLRLKRTKKTQFSLFLPNAHTLANLYITGVCFPSAGREREGEILLRWPAREEAKEFPRRLAVTGLDSWLCALSECSTGREERGPHPSGVSAWSARARVPSIVRQCVYKLLRCALAVMFRRPVERNPKLIVYTCKVRRGYL